MSLAGALLFMIWVSIVVFAISGWAFMTIQQQDNSLYDWEDDDDFNDEVGQKRNRIKIPKSLDFGS